MDVRQGDKIQFYQGEGLGRDTMALRGLLTQTAYGVQRSYSPCEMTDTQGGASGVWFYCFNSARKPDPGGKYPLIPEYSAALGALGGWGSLPPAPQMPQPVGCSAIWKVVAGDDAALAVDDVLPLLAPGVYRAEAVARGKDGQVLARAWQNFIRYDHEKDLPWIGNKLGVSDKVQPPWTPIRSQKSEVGGQPSVGFSCWGREYQVDGSGLLAGLKVAAQSGVDQKGLDILASPVRMELVQDGKPVTLRPGAAPAGITVADAQASWSGALSGEGWRIETAVALEYDGYAFHRINIVPPNPQAKMDALRLIIPLKREYAMQLHAVGGGPGQWFRHSVNSLSLDTVKSGRLWHSGQNSGLGDKPYNEEYGAPQLAGNFRPYVWLGGATRGLAFMADNDKDWVPADKDQMKQHPSVEIVRPADRPDTVNLVLNLVARPFVFDRTRTVEFSLQATPIRPSNPDFRRCMTCLDLRTAFTGVYADGPYKTWDWNGMRYQLPGMTWAHIGFMHGPHWYPINWDAMIASRKKFEGEKNAFTPYQMQGGVHFTDVDDPRMPKGKQLSDVFGYIAPHTHRGNIDNSNMSPDQIDYRLWCYDAWFKGVGIKGLYFDITEPLMDANVLSGAGYVLDLPDRPKLTGKVQPGFSFTKVRQF
ncbi:MAG: DUF6067 family protein, partial [Planctomycetota bacterium]|nr:DUF6067 family protein [Planctomycetota bacterium]